MERLFPKCIRIFQLGLIIQLLSVFVVCAQQTKMQNTTTTAQQNATDAKKQLENDEEFVWVEDPNQKPQIWAYLKKNPHDSIAWARYNGMPWSKLTPELRVRTKLIMQTLWGRLKVEQKSNPIKTDTQTPKEDFTEILRRPAVRSFIAELEEVMLSEPLEMEELKENPFENFFIIEEYYTEAFKEFSETYMSYNQKYPQGGFSEARWIEEHDKKLRALKKQKLESIKLDFLRAQASKSNSTASAK